MQTYRLKQQKKENKPWFSFFQFDETKREINMVFLFQFDETLQTKIKVTIEG